MKRRTLLLSSAGAVVAIGLIAYVLSLGGAGESSRYAPDLDDASDATQTAGAVETTGTGMTDPAEMDTGAGDAPVLSIRERHAGGGQGEGSTSDGDGADGSDTTGGTDSGDSGGGTRPPGTTPSTPAEPVAPITLTLEERKAFYWELIEAQDRAVLEADAKYPMDDDPPNVDAYVTLWLELTGTYEEEVRRKYGLSAAQAEIVIEEGLVNNWPMPPYPIQQGQP